MTFTVWMFDVLNVANALSCDRWLTKPHLRLVYNFCIATHCFGLTILLMQGCLYILYREEYLFQTSVTVQVLLRKRFNAAWRAIKRLPSRLSPGPTGRRTSEITTLTSPLCVVCLWSRPHAMLICGTRRDWWEREVHARLLALAVHNTAMIWYLGNDYGHRGLKWHHGNQHRCSSSKGSDEIVHDRGSLGVWAHVIEPLLRERICWNEA